MADEKQKRGPLDRATASKDEGYTNRNCRFPASGFPIGFTVTHTGRNRPHASFAQRISLLRWDRQFCDKAQASHRPFSPRSRTTPPPWRADTIPGGYVVRDANGQAIAYIYSRENEAEARRFGRQFRM